MSSWLWIADESFWRRAIPSTPEDFPNELRYDAAARRLFIGKGYVDNVSQAMVDYDVSGMNVLTQWFSYRKKDRRRPIIGDRRPPSPLSDIQPDHWLAEYTSDLLDLLHVLGRLVGYLSPHKPGCWRTSWARPCSSMSN